MYLQSRVVPRDILHMAVGAPGGESLAEQEFEVHAMCIVCASVLPALRSLATPYSQCWLPSTKIRVGARWMPEAAYSDTNGHRS